MEFGLVSATAGSLGLVVQGILVTVTDRKTAVSDKRAAEIAGISVRRLRYWEKTDVIRPDVERRISPRNVVRLYSLPRLIELAVASELRHQGVSLQHIRRIIDYLRQEGYEAPLREVRFARSGDRVLFQHADGTWEESGRPYQGLIVQVIDLDQIRARVQGRLGRRETDAGVVEQRRKVQASKPVFRGTRVPLAAVVGYLEAGKTTDEILAAFPSLTEEDIEAAKAASSAVA